MAAENSGREGERREGVSKGIRWWGGREQGRERGKERAREGMMLGSRRASVEEVRDEGLVKGTSEEGTRHGQGQREGGSEQRRD